ncbi:MAG: biotin/lipoyl-binding protein, partial [Flavobacteriales bacterium]|nr:biotin/lipoyl-binding protein [Flavobacteriales bacterium]
MKKKIGIAVLVTGIVYASSFFIKSNSKALLDYETTTLTIATIENKIVATGKVVPEDEVEIKPQIAGIIEKIMVQEGEKVNAGDLLAIIKVVPNEQSLNNAQGRVKNSEYILTNMQSEFDRNKTLYSKGIISEQEY